MRLGFWICWLPLLLLHNVKAQGLLKGRVIDEETGEGLIGAHIYSIVDWRKGTVSGADGKFELSVDPKDSLVVTYLGFKETVVSAMTTEIKLVPIETVGEEVVISAEPLVAEEFKFMKIQKLEIYTNPAAKADPLLAVNSLPSATTTDETANISLRGSSPLETGIFLNNVPLYDGVRYAQLNGVGTFSIFNTSIIKDVTVFPGNPPLEFGNTTAGIVSLTTDDAILKANSNSAIISMANLSFSREQRLNDQASLKIFTNWQPSGFFKAVNSEALEEIESFESVDLGLYLYGANEYFTWKFFNYTLLEGYEVNFSHPSYSGLFNQKKRRTFITSTLEHVVNEQSRWSWNQMISFSDGDFAYSNVSFSTDKYDLFGSLNYQYSQLKYVLKTGVSYDRRNARVMGNFHEFSYARSETHPTVDIDGEQTSELLEVFSYLKYYASDRISIAGGIRKNIPKDQIFNEWSGQVNVAYLKGPWSVTLGSGRYYKKGLEESTGSLFQSTSNQSSVDIKYEDLIFQGALSVFTKANAINGSPYQSNGIELFTSYQYLSKLSCSVSLTLLDAKSSATDIYPFDLGYFVRGNVSYQTGDFWTFEGIFSAREGTLYRPVASARYDPSLDVFEPLFDESVDRLPNYFNISLSISKLFPVSEKMNMIGFFNLNNVTDFENVRAFNYSRDYSSFDPSYFSRRIVYAGVVVNF